MDYYARKDLQAITTWSAASLFDFGGSFHEQTIWNESSDTTYELSWDGVNIHALLVPGGQSQVIGYSNHIRNKVWVRRQLGSGGAGAKYVTIIGASP